MKTWKDNNDPHLASPEAVADVRRRIEARLLTAHPSVGTEEQKVRSQQ